MTQLPPSLTVSHNTLIPLDNVAKCRALPSIDAQAPFFEGEINSLSRVVYTFIHKITISTLNCHISTQNLIYIVFFNEY